MEKHEIFAKNLEAIRRANNQSLAEFAEEAGIPKSTLQSVRLSGHTTLDTAIRIADSLNLPLDSLVGDERLAEKLDFVQYLIRGLEGFLALSAGEQDEAILHIQKLLEVFHK